MPYIKEERRKPVLIAGGQTPGELNFEITQACINYWTCYGPSYQTLNDIMGALEGAKQEFYRRTAGPYEDQKIKENGDVY